MAQPLVSLVRRFRWPACAFRTQTGAPPPPVMQTFTRAYPTRPSSPVARGILDTCLVHPREVFRTAVRIAAASVIIVHNHPSGDCTPSIEDIRMTRQLVEAGRILDIQVLDHIVVGRRTAGQEEDFISMRESGLVAF